MALERLAFKAEWFNPQAEQALPYTLFYYPPEKAVEVFDVKNQRTFLKKTKYDVELPELRVGNEINIYARQFRILGYADAYTEQQLQGSAETAQFLVAVDGLPALGAILRDALGGLSLAAARMVHLDERQLAALVGAEQCQAWPRAAGVSRAPFVAVQAAGAGARAAVQAALAQRVAQHQALLLPAGADALADGGAVAADLSRATLCVVKPHVLQDARRTGELVQYLLDHGPFGVVALQVFRLNEADAAEFYKVYRGVLPNYQDTVNELVAGPCLALAVVSTAAQSDVGVVELLRELAGPADVEVARALRPQSLRAVFGVDAARNAVHVTDLAQDGALECKYFFELLQE